MYIFPIVLSFVEGQYVAITTVVSVKGVLPALSSFGCDHSGNSSYRWIFGSFAIPATSFHLFFYFY
ncbi:hypothetical protein HanRHA438_Chr09g0386371 [Helianthus annuus]|nr:hypothetical protein HanRHA438_Chr09g0386371 [Helianthus annuus]